MLLFHLQFLALKGFLGIFSTAIQIARDSYHNRLKTVKKNSGMKSGMKIHYQKFELHLRAGHVYGVLPGLVVVEEILETEQLCLQY